LILGEKVVLLVEHVAFLTRRALAFLLKKTVKNLMAIGLVLLHFAKMLVATIQVLAAFLMGVANQTCKVTSACY
jgi:hypothetical protein